MAGEPKLNYNGKVIVTGGAGFIGSYITEKLVKMGKEVIVIDNFSSGNVDNLKNVLSSSLLKIVKADLKKDGEWPKYFRDAEIVFHYAANPEVRISSINPRTHFEENIIASFNVLEATRKYDVKYIVFASSSTVYGDAKKIPTPEDYHPLEPISVYGASKLAVENLIISYTKLYGLRALILRYANIIGPRSSHGVIIDFIKKLKRNPLKLEILGDGSQRKSYLYITDALEATFHLLNYFMSKAGKEYDVFNIGNYDWITVNEIAQIVVKVLGLSKVEFTYKPATSDGRGWPGDVKFMLLDISKATSTGWKPKYTSREAVELTARYYARTLWRQI